MDSRQHTTIVNFIWAIADDVLRDVYVRGKCRGVILAMTFTRHFYKPTSLRTLEEIRHDLLVVQAEGEGLLDEILGITGGSK